MVGHAFPLMGFAGLSVNVTFCGSLGIMSTARPELPYSCISKAKSLVVLTGHAEQVRMKLSS